MPLDLVQKQKATVVDIVMHPDDARLYASARPGEIFRPRYLPAGKWLQVDDFASCQIWQELLPYVSSYCDED